MTRHGIFHKPESDWLDPLNRQIIQVTVKHNKTKLTLRDGRKFTVVYATNPHREETVELIPFREFGLVPRGTFLRSTILNKGFPTSEVK